MKSVFSIATTAITTFSVGTANTVLSSFFAFIQKQAN